MPTQSEKNRDEPDWVDRDKKRNKRQEEFCYKRLHIDRLSSHAAPSFAKSSTGRSQTALGSKPQAAASRISHLPCSERTRSRFKDTSRLAVRGVCVYQRPPAHRSGAARSAAATAPVPHTDSALPGLSFPTCSGSAFPL